MTMTLVSTTTLATATASITFSGIPQTATDLVISISARQSASSFLYTSVAINGDTANFIFRQLAGNGSTVQTAAAAANRIDYSVGYASFTASTFSNTSIYIPNYAAATNKTLSIDSVVENNATAGWQTVAAGSWASTAAITSITFGPFGTTYAQDTTISLYTITKGSGGATVA